MAATASAQTTNDRLNSSFALEDDDCAASDATVTLVSTFFSVTGTVTGTGSTSTAVGTTGPDNVRITYDTPLPSSGSANSKTGKVNQSKFGRLNFFIDTPGVVNGGNDTGAAGVTGTPEKCSIKGSVNDDKSSGKTHIFCKSDTLYTNLSTNQVASFQTAFPKGNDCNVKIKVDSDNLKGSVEIDLKQKGSSSSN